MSHDVLTTPVRNRVFWALVDGFFLQTVLSIATFLCIALGIGLDVLIPVEPLTRLVFPFVIGASALIAYAFFVVYYLKMPLIELGSDQRIPLLFIFLVFVSVQVSLALFTITTEGLVFSDVKASAYVAVAVLNMLLMAAMAYMKAE